MWGEIKKAINSTVGTEDFKPLDELIKDYAVKPIIAVYSASTADLTISTANGEKTYSIPALWANDGKPTYIELDSLGEITASWSNWEYDTATKNIKTVGIYNLYFKIPRTFFGDELSSVFSCVDYTNSLLYTFEPVSTATGTYSDPSRVVVHLTSALSNVSIYAFDVANNLLGTFVEMNTSGISEITSTKVDGGYIIKSSNGSLKFSENGIYKITSSSSAAKISCTIYAQE